MKTNQPSQVKTQRRGTNRGCLSAGPAGLSALSNPIGRQTLQEQLSGTRCARALSELPFPRGWSRCLAIIRARRGKPGLVLPFSQDNVAERGK